jgi:hypothetical protein
MSYRRTIPCNRCSAPLYWEKNDRIPYEQGTNKHHNCPVWLAEQAAKNTTHNNSQATKVNPDISTTAVLPPNQKPLFPAGQVDTMKEVQQNLREVCTILQGIAAQLENIADNQDVANRYAKVTKDVLTEWIEEYKDVLNKPKMSFESGRIEDVEDIVDEIADVDNDKPVSGFKPADFGSKNVRNDI